MNRTTLLVLIGAAIAVLIAGWGVVMLWSDLGVTMTPHGWAAYALGAIGSLALSGGLFWLLFHSARHGHDDIERPEDDDG